MADSESWVTTISWSPDGDLLATGSTEGAARIFSTGSGEVVHGLQLDGPVCALAWSPDGSLLAVACTNGDTSIIDAGSGEVRHRLQARRTAADETRAGIRHGEAELQDLQTNIERVRTQTGQEREDRDEHQTPDEGESSAAAPG
ncbi:MAG: hypothetical protein M3N98_15715 [Actinomycetota bacterium]|nr:hypothetical protein [Actinomycetota bacterium]